ncbi:MAG: LemA family protein [Clostridiaceae bacterium]|nr:LemA family protein [Clostridiaceae bacterium]
MKKGFTALIVVGVIVLIIVFSGVGAYNNLVAKSENVETQLSQIDNQLQRRNDLIPNLVETVKGYAAHEQEIFTSVAEARSKLAGAASVSDRADASSELTNALNRLIAIAENYPQLKANENFIQLSTELAGTENRIAVARMDYNEAARDYNTTIRKFPTVILANLFGFEKAEYFEADESARDVPKVDFTN